MDLFEKWLNNKDSKWMEIALTDRSFNNYRKRGIRKNDPLYAEVQKDLPENKDLAVVGDAVINLVYSKYLFTKGTNKLTVEETTLSLAKTIMSLVQIKKYIDNDDNARKLYYELIERYVDIKSDIELKMLMNIDEETNFQKTKVFNNVDEFLFTKFKKA